MEEEFDPNIIKATQLSLGKYVKRPPLSDKLLRKPPFRFLHDIVTSILKSKGFFSGLFEDNELISENVKDRESKIDFLNKVVTVVSLTTGETLSVKPSKIVAGQEPAKTNKLLQCLARALDQNLSSDEAVKQFKAGVKIHQTSDKKSKESIKSVKKQVDLKKLTSKSSEKLTTNEKNGQHLKSKHKENAVHKKESPPKKPASKVSNKKPIEKSTQEVFPQQIDSNEQKNKLSINKKIVSNDLAVLDTEQKKSSSNKDNVDFDEESKLNEKKSQPEISLHEDIDISVMTVSNNNEPPVLDRNESSSQSTIADNSIPTFKDEDKIKINKDVNVKDDMLIIAHKNEMNGEDNENKSMQENNDNGVTEAFKDDFEQYRNSNVNVPNKNNVNDSTVTIRPSSVRPSSSRPGAPRLRNKSDNIINDTENILVGKVNIITENSLQEEEDEDTSIIVENNTTDELLENVQDQEHSNLAGNQSSHLVQQILDSQKEYSQAIGKTEIEWQFGAQKTPDVFIQEMEQLKFNVQALSRIANPLGKLLDHIQEDVEVMRQELQQWTKLYEETSKDLLKQKSANEESLLPLHTKLKQLSVDIAEKHEKITDLKVCIHKNASRIDKLLSSGNVQ